VIEKALADDGKQRRYTVVVEQNLTHARLDELIDEHRDAIIGFHYGGHADSVIGHRCEHRIGCVMSSEAPLCRAVYRVTKYEKHTAQPVAMRLTPNLANGHAASHRRM